jgi:hypothetical protein
MHDQIYINKCIQKECILNELYKEKLTMTREQRKTRSKHADLHNNGDVVALTNYCSLKFAIISHKKSKAICKAILSARITGCKKIMVRS